MKRPVWSFQEVRDTNAPLAVVAPRLKDAMALKTWHPRLAGAPLEIVQDSDVRLMLRYVWSPVPGLIEEGELEATGQGDRTLLAHRARFKGWLVLPLMGWWRLRSHRMWERFVETL